MLYGFLKRVNENVKLKGNKEKHEQTGRWSNRDLIPLPPTRRTWGLMEYYGYWTIAAFGVVTWQTPNTFLTAGLSVKQSIAVIVVSRFIIFFWAVIVAWAGLKFHIGYTVQNRYSWGMRAAYIPLLQRVLLNFIWTAVQCWNGGKLVAVCLTAMFPSFATMKNTFPNSVPMTTSENVSFVVFWFLSLPFLWLPPEKFRVPFQVSSVYCGVAMLCIMIWSLSVAKGVGPLFNTGQTTLSTGWSLSWTIMSCLNSSIGIYAAGMTNGSDFSRYAKNKSGYIAGTALCYFLTGILVSFVGLVTTAACQKIYGEIYWNPPDLFMVMMDSGKGSSKSRAGVFFLALGFALPTLFDNIVGNATAGGIDLAGIFPQYINIRRGAIITFFAAWICQPWQMINRATTFIDVVSSFSIFLAPLMGIMVADFYLIRNMRIKLSDLYKSHGSFFFWHGVNWRAIPAWVVGWAPTVGGLALTAKADTTGSRVVYQFYYVSFFYGFFASFSAFYVTNRLFPVPGCGDTDEVDVFGTFTNEEAKKIGCLPPEGVGVSNGSLEVYEKVNPGVNVGNSHANS